MNIHSSSINSHLKHFTTFKHSFLVCAKVQLALFYTVVRYALHHHQMLHSQLLSHMSHIRYILFLNSLSPSISCSIYYKCLLSSSSPFFFLSSFLLCKKVPHCVQILGLLHSNNSCPQSLEAEPQNRPQNTC